MIFDFTLNRTSELGQQLCGALGRCSNGIRSRGSGSVTSIQQLTMDAEEGHVMCCSDRTCAGNAHAVIKTFAGAELCLCVQFM